MRTNLPCLEGARDWGWVPLELACMGPKAVELAGELCAGVIVDGHMGGNGEGARATVAAGRRLASRRWVGRDPTKLRYIAAIDGAIEDQRGPALDQVRQTAARNIARKPYLPIAWGSSMRKQCARSVRPIAFISIWISPPNTAISSRMKSP